MIVNILENISNTYTEERELIKSRHSESRIIYPEKGYMIRNKKTGETYETYVILGTHDSLDNYEEIEIEQEQDLD